MRDVVVIGAGLFGCVIARALRSQGMDVEILDDRRENAGSKPAACLMKPSWFSSLGPKVYRPALDMLSSLYDVQDLSMRVGPANALVHWIEPTSILGGETVTKGTVIKISQADEGWRVEYRNPMNSEIDFTARKVIVAAGIWSSELVPVQDLSPRWGVAFCWDGQIEQGSITPWAPYRQLVSFNRGPNEIWASDGTATKVWKDELATVCERRVSDATKLGKPDRVLLGIRPYVKDAKPAYLREHMPGLWVATGGAKNGTLAAGWCAAQLVDAL